MRETSSAVKNRYNAKVYKPIMVSLKKNSVVFFVVFLLGLLRGGILLDALVDQSGNNLNFFVQSINLCIQFGVVGGNRPHYLTGLDDLLSIAHQLIVCLEEHLLNALCGEGWCSALGFAVEFAVAPPHLSAVCIRGVPHLFAIKATAVTANQFAGKNARTAVGTPQALSAGNLCLHSVEVHCGDDCRMATFHIILQNFAFVDFLLFGEKIHREFFLVRVTGVEPAAS